MTILLGIRYIYQKTFYVYVTIVHSSEALRNDLVLKAT